MLPSSSNTHIRIEEINIILYHTAPVILVSTLFAADSATMAMAVAQEGRVKRQLGSIRQQKSQQHAVPRNGARAALGTRPQAARVCGTEIPNNKPLYISLTRIYGIGESRAWETLASCGVENKRVRDLSEDELARIRDHISGTYLVEGDLVCSFFLLYFARLRMALVACVSLVETIGTFYVCAAFFFSLAATRAKLGYQAPD